MVQMRDDLLTERFCNLSPNLAWIANCRLITALGQCHLVAILFPSLYLIFFVYSPSALSIEYSLAFFTWITWICFSLFSLHGSYGVDYLYCAFTSSLTSEQFSSFSSRFPVLQVGIFYYLVGPRIKHGTGIKCDLPLSYGHFPLRTNMKYNNNNYIQ